MEASRGILNGVNRRRFGCRFIKNCDFWLHDRIIMSRIYDNKPLSSLTVDNIDWKGPWSPESYKQGDGVLMEGIVKGRSRQNVDDKTKKVRYTSFHIAVRRAYRRRFTASGVEIEPNFSETEKVRTGFLNSSYKTVAKGCDDTLSSAELGKLIQPVELVRLTDRRNIADCVVLWIEESSLEGVEINVGDAVRVRTSGDGPFIDSVIKVEAEMQSSTTVNYSGGEQVGSSWTDKIMAVKGARNSESGPSVGAQPGDCADDDEWAD